MARNNLEALFLEAFPQYRDRLNSNSKPLSRQEAQAIRDWALRTPEVVAAHNDRSSPWHALVKQYANGLEYWRSQHPQNEDGSPVAVELHEKDPYPDLAVLWTYTPDQAEKRMRELEAHPEFALNDEHHPEHHIAKEGWRRLMLRAAGGQAPLSEADEQLARFRAVTATDPEHPFTNPAHPGHAEARKEHDKLIEAAHPDLVEQAGVSRATEGGDGLGEPKELEALRSARTAIISDPEKARAYTDRSHRLHQSVFAELSKLDAAIVNAEQGPGDPGPGSNETQPNQNGGPE